MYNNTYTNIIITCPIHGDFEQTPKNHLKGCGCSKCKGNKNSSRYQLDLKDLLVQFKAIHGDTYLYSKVVCTTKKKKVIITCRLHGDFEQAPANHLLGRGCPICKNIALSEKFKKYNNLEEVALKFSNLDFSNFEYEGVHTKGEIRCKKCGVIFFDSIVLLRNRTINCYYCSDIGERKYTKETLINKLNSIHNNKYDYSKLELCPLREKAHLICSIHGSFSMSIANHLGGQGCSKCGTERTKNILLKDSSTFFKECNETHKNYYDYSKSVYKGAFEKMLIICPKHGEFYQSAKVHSSGSGCSKCLNFRGENTISSILDQQSITYEKQKTFKGCIYKGLLKFDFYLPDFNMCIEYDGAQHFKPVVYWGGDKSLKIQREKDSIKTNYCKTNGMPLLRIPYTEFNNIEKILSNEIYRSY